MARLADGGARHAPRDRLDRTTRLSVRVTGAVQGVGFRPYVYRLAHELGLSGYVLNDAAGVLIEIEGAQTDAFLARLEASPPPLARLASIAVETLPALGDLDFKVLQSARGREPANACIPPDSGICRACAAEMFDSNNRRAYYPFIACCDCGPRYTMTRALPYDRPQTSMAAFPLCSPCAEEYDDPLSRRFHAEPTACARCGPMYDESPGQIHARLRAGEIVAVKGVGGFHLMADALNTDVVATLRARKQRDAKPFAVLVANLASARRIAMVSDQEAELLQSPARPVVLLRANPDAPPVAPGLKDIGVMLPATGLHWLLFWHAAGCPENFSLDEPRPDVFICTSANPAGEPLAISGPEARARLSTVADAVVDHDREILARADDPVLRLVNSAPVYIRRGRGGTPEPIELPADIPPTIGFGAHLKASPCVTRGREAFLAPHVGDLDAPELIRTHREAIAHLLAILDVRPERAACDLHPDFASTRAAFAFGLPVVQVQHHHAHAAACAAENHIAGPYLALTLDGYGLAEDGTAWGGELLKIDTHGPQWLGGLKPLPLPGADAAAREPWRMGAAALHAAGATSGVAARFARDPRAAAIEKLLARPGAPTTSAAGRYFDAAAGLLAICDRQTYEAEAPMRLEALAIDAPPSGGLWRLDGPYLDLSNTFLALNEADPHTGASLFHAALADGLAALAASAAAVHGLSDVVLTGGCCVNRVLVERLVANLRRAGLRPHTHRQSPPGDAGLSLGQAWLAGSHQGDLPCA